MPASSAALARIIRQLQTERQQHADAIAAIDEQFEQHGITAVCSPDSQLPVKSSGFGAASTCA